MKRFNLWLVIGVLSIAALFAQGSNAQEEKLLTSLPKTRSFESDLKMIQSAPVAFHPNAIGQRSQSSLTLDTFDNKTIVIEPTLIEKEGQLGELQGQVEGYPLSEVVLSWTGKIGAGTINLGNGDIYRLRYTGDAGHVLEQLPAEYLPVGNTALPVGAQLRTQNELEDQPTRSQQSSKSVIDVLVLYSADAETAMGGDEGSANTIRIAETESNLGFENSNINVEFNIVHSKKVDFDESQYDFSQMLGVLTQTDDGVLDQVHALRDYYGADIVTMLVDRPLLCGKTYQNNGLYKDFSKFAFVVLHYSCATGYYSFAHEIGHVMGSQHNREHAGHTGAFPYSYGYRDPAHRFRTIMAYNCEASCTRVNHWSNPNVFYSGMGATGVDPSQPNGAHNSMSLSLLAPSVSQFRDRVLPEDQTTVINFQSASMDISDGSPASLQDIGEPLGDRGNGLVYGWSTNALISVSDEDGSAAAESTFVSAGSANGDVVQWEMLLPNGNYRVRIVSGTAEQSQQDGMIGVEGFEFPENGHMLSQAQVTTGVIDEERIITISDGRLSIFSLNNQMQLTLNLIEITPLDEDGNLTGPNFEPTTTIFLPVIVR